MTGTARGRSIGQAISDAATERFFTYSSEAPDPMPPENCRMSRDEWESLSPGYRRAISREFAPPPPPMPPKQSLDEKRRAVEYAGRKRL